MIPARKRKLAYGVGINDADYFTQNKSGNKCEFYRKWVGMIERCHSKSFQENNPSYIGCSVCDEWLTFSCFKSWMEKQEWAGLQLDKDIISPGNKIYSPEFCAFVSGSLNKLLTNSRQARGNCPQGVCWSWSSRSFLAQIKINGKRKYLGSYKTQELASSAYVKAKTKLIIQAADEQTDSRVSKGLRLHAELLTLNKG